jgi:hypothetical protein
MEEKELTKAREKLGVLIQLSQRVLERMSGCGK